MNKQQIVEILAERLDKKKNEVKNMVEELFNLIIEEMVKGNAVRIVGFGEFEVRRRIARDGINPKTGKKIKIAATKTPSFMAGKALKDAVKGRKKGGKKSK
jgi:nucleoid DNA-binding protein